VKRPGFLVALRSRASSRWTESCASYTGTSEVGLAWTLTVRLSQQQARATRQSRRHSSAPALWIRSQMFVRRLRKRDGNARAVTIGVGRNSPNDEGLPENSPHECRVA
jgi:hypothetical protein